MAEPWTNGIRDAVAAVVGGDAIQAGARSAEEARLLKAQAARAAFDNRMLQNQALVQQRDANASLDQFDFDPQTLALMRSKLGSQYSGATAGNLNVQKFGATELAMEAASRGDWATMNAIKGANATGPSKLFGVSGGREAENVYLPYGGATRDTPLAMQQIRTSSTQAAENEAAAALLGAKTTQVPLVAAAQIANYQETGAGGAGAEKRKTFNQFLTEFGLSKENPEALAAWQTYNAEFEAAQAVGGAATTVGGNPVVTGKAGATNGPPANAAAAKPKAVVPVAAIEELRAAVKAGDAAAAAEFEAYFGVPAKNYLQ